MELNTRYSNSYKRYNKLIPQYLQNKARKFLNHYMERITSALDIKEEQIKEGENKGEFHIRSTTCNSTWYDLSFGGDNMIPKYTFTDFTAQVYHANTFLLFLNTVKTGSGMHFQRGTVKIRMSPLTMLLFLETQLMMSSPSQRVRLTLNSQWYHNQKYNQGWQQTVN